jgi:hypothetical protein
MHFVQSPTSVQIQSEENIFWFSSSLVGFEVLRAARMKMSVFWVVAPCNLEEVYQHFRGTCCLPDYGGNKYL